MRYNPALDGLRAVAITLVILAHSFRHLFAGGWIGVDVFFVLSGFLITSILIREIDQTGQIAWGNFYWRRFLRLSPALLILAAFQFAHSAISPHNGAEIREATWIGLAYLQNLNLAFHWAPADMVAHTWSLATEEQFYLLWPLTLLFIARRRPLLWVGTIAAALVSARLLLWRYGASPGHIQYGPDTRPVGLLIGCGLALIPIGRWPHIPAAAPFSGLALLFLLGVAGGDDLNWLLISAPIIASLSAAVIVVAAQSGGALARTLSFSPVVYIGRISYGLYLYSVPICFLGAIKGINPLLLITLSFIAAALSYELVERPILKLKDRFRSTPVLLSPQSAGAR